MGFDYRDIKDQQRISYDKEVNDNLYAVTITSRNHYRDPIKFRSELYEFLSGIKYRYAIQGVFETHNQRGREDKLHVHGVTYTGCVPKGNKSNPFYFKIKRITDESGWNTYCHKNA